MPITHTISSNAEIRKIFANTISKQTLLIKEYHKTRNCGTGDIVTFRADNKIIYNLITKANHHEKPTVDTINTTIKAMSDHALGLNLRRTARPKMAWLKRKGLERSILHMWINIFENSGITIYVCKIKDGINKLQIVETNTFEQGEMLDIIENRLIEN